MSEISQIDAVQSVRDTIEKMIQTVKELPEATIRWNPSADEWSIMQIITHVAEAIPYWLKEIRSIQENPDLVWGRGLADEIRLKTVSEENVKNLTPEQVLTNLAKIPAMTEETIGSLTVKDLSLKAPSRNPKFDGKPVQFIVDHLVVEHIEKHYGQIQRNLSKR